MPYFKYYPNPFSQNCRFDYLLTRRAKSAVLKVYAVTGQLLKEIEGPAHTGANVIYWNGQNGQGHGVSSGIYIYRLEVTGSDARDQVIRKTGRVVRLK